MTGHEMDLMLGWRRRRARVGDAASLCDSLTVERLPYAGIPATHYAAVVSFRHLRQDRRLARCVRYFSERP